MNNLAMRGPKTMLRLAMFFAAFHEDPPAKGNEERKTRAMIGPLYLFGTSSPSTMPKESCPAAANPFMRFAPIRVSMFFAVPPTMHPRRPKKFVAMTIHFRPKMSDILPTIPNPMALPMVQMVATQLRFAEGPISSLIKALRLH